jgi:glycosyltransferase involved in cell wall biosynthesis
VPATVKQPRITVGLPVRNGEAFLEESLDSLTSQTFEDFEIVISDNASSDRTPEICRDHAAKDRRIRYVRNETNLGQTANLHRPIQLARGRYYRMHHDDDRLHSRCLEACVEVLDREPSVVLSHTFTELIDGSGSVVQPKDPYDYDIRQRSAADRLDAFLRLRYDDPPRPALFNVVFGLIRREVLFRTPIDGPYPHADVIHFAGILLHGAFAVVSEVLFSRRDHPGRSMRAHTDLRALALFRNPASAANPVTPHWSGLVDLHRLVRRAPLSRTEQLRCHQVITTRYMALCHRALIHEGLREGLRRIGRLGRQEAS